MTTVYTPDGKPLDVPEDQAQALLSSGKAGLPAGQDVHVHAPGGGIAVVKSEELPAAFADGARLAGPEAIRKAQLQKEYGGLGQQALTGVQGLASGASLGATDEALKALGVPGVEEREEANPGTYLGSSLIGAILPAVATEGGTAPESIAEAGGALAKAGEAASLGTRVLGAPTRAVAGTGRAIESAVGSLLGLEESGSAVSRLAKSALAKGAGAAAEGAAYGLADQIHEDVLGDHELNAEKLYASGLHGALLGLGMGVGLSAAGEIGSHVLGRATPTLGRMAEEQAVRTINPRKAFTKEMQRIPGGAEGVGRRLLDEGTIRAGDTIEDIAPRVAAAEQKAGAKVGAVLDAADAAGFEGPSVRAVQERAQREILSDLEKMPESNATAIGNVKKLLRDLEVSARIPSPEEALAAGTNREVLLDNARLSFRQMQEFRGNLGKRIDWKVNPLAVRDEMNEARKALYGVLESELESQGEKAAAKMGGSFLEEYREAKLAYRQLTTASKAAQDALAARQANRIASPSDYITGAAGLAGGLHEGLGGMLHGGLTGLAAGAAHHVIRERGNATAAAILDKLAVLRGVERASRAVDREMDRSIAGLLKEEGRAAPSEPRQAHPYREHALAVSRAASAPDVHAARVEQASAPLAAVAPRIATAFRSTALRAVEYLNKAAPHRIAPQTLTPQLDEPRLSRADEHRHRLEQQAVDEPMSVFFDAAQNRATRAQVKALASTSPKMFQQYLGKLQSKLATRKEPLDYEQRKQLAILFGAAAGPEFDPKFTSRMQDDFRTAPQPGGPGPGSRGGSAPKRKLESPAHSIRLTGS